MPVNAIWFLALEFLNKRILSYIKKTNECQSKSYCLLLLVHAHEPVKAVIDTKLVLADSEVTRWQN
jgi:hypothetical protein